MQQLKNVSISHDYKNCISWVGFDIFLFWGTFHILMRGQPGTLGQSRVNEPELDLVFLALGIKL